MKRSIFNLAFLLVFFVLPFAALQTTGAQTDRVRLLLDESRAPACWTASPGNMRWDVPQQRVAPQTYRVPDAQNKQLKQLIDAQDKLAQEYNRIEAQKVIVAQRAALELSLTAKQLDGLELVVDAQGFFFRPVEKKPDPAKPAVPRSDQ